MKLWMKIVLVGEVLGIGAILYCADIIYTPVDIPPVETPCKQEKLASPPLLERRIFEQ